MTEQYGDRLKVGVITPSTNTTLETDCHDFRSDGITVHTSRIAIQNRTITGAQAYDDHVEAMRVGIEDAIARVMTCAPQHLIMGVALEAFWGGLAGSTKLQAELEQGTGVPVTLGSTAMDAALKHLKFTRIAVLTPHMPAGDEQVRQWFVEAGYELIRFKGLRCESPRKIAEVSVSDMRAAVEELNDDDAQVIVQVGTNLQFARFARAAQVMLGKPVLALNAVMWWDSLRRHRIEANISGADNLG